MHVVELAPRMSPAGREIDAAAEPLEAGIAIDLQNAPELRKISLLPFSLLWFCGHSSLHQDCEPSETDSSAADAPLIDTKAH
jgi:hypothetical protein